VGLIQRAAEDSGIATVSMGNETERMAKIKPPRALKVKFGRGSMFGEPGNAYRQRRIVMDALDALKTMNIPGTVRELPYQWRRPD